MATDFVQLALDVVGVMNQWSLDPTHRDEALRWMRNWDVDRYREEYWEPPLRELVGDDGRVIEEVEVVGTLPAATVRLQGDVGTALVVIGFQPKDETVKGIVFEPPAHGIRNIVIGGPSSGHRPYWEGATLAMAEMWAALLGMRIVNREWLTIAGVPGSAPRLAFGDGWSDARPPRWPPDPEHPQQMHLDVAVRDLDAAHRIVTRRGATSFDERGARRVYTDPVGHAFCLYEDDAAPEDHGRIGRVVFDAADPDRTATFWQTLLNMPVRVIDETDHIAIARDDGIDGPMLALQRSDAPPPSWPDDDFPEQLHLDLFFVDGKAAMATAERLGSVRLPAPPYTTVYADPGGHPFCIGSPHRA
jgi:predicted enzyme related to lactoylglutathione lyase